MIDPTRYTLFIAAALTLLISPGPAVLYIIARSIEQGRLAGVVSVIGVGLGSMVHVIAAAVGLSALLVSSAVIFGIVKYLGAAYLLYLGIKTILSKPIDPSVAKTLPQPLRRTFWQGVIVNVLNPKTALFFFAFLPQFVNPRLGQIPLQFVILGMTFVFLAIITDTIYALAAGSAGAWLQGNRKFFQGQRYFSGGIYILLGIGTAISGQSGK